MLGRITTTDDDYVPELSVRKPYVIINVKSMGRTENLASVTTLADVLCRSSRKARPSNSQEGQQTNAEGHDRTFINSRRLSVTTARTCIFIYIPASHNGA
jgi:hypothetical protein